VFESNASNLSADAPVILEVLDLTVAVEQPRIFRSNEKLTLLDDVNLKVVKGETLGIQGPSGAGKSTLAQAILALNPLASGQVLLNGSNLLAMSAPELRRTRQQIQLVLQNSSSLSPYHRVRDILAEPLRNFGVNKNEWKSRIDQVLKNMSLGPEMGDRFPNQLSGGQQQRVSIARALIVEPEIVIFDEPVSALDRVVQISVLEDLKRRQIEDNLTFVVITHDSHIASYMCDNVLTLVNGRVT